LEPDERAACHRFFTSLNPSVLLYIKHRVTEPETVRAWCEQIHFGRILPLLARSRGEIIGRQEDATKVFARLGFGEVARLDDYVKDMQAISHD
jgi:hypothetical protein